jgi:flagellar motility protein MotE (MotC chaperone)
MRECVTSDGSFDSIEDADLERLSIHLRESTQHCAAQRQLADARTYDELWRRCRAEIKLRRSESDRRSEIAKREKDVSELEQAYRTMETKFVSRVDDLIVASLKTHTQISCKTRKT